MHHNAIKIENLIFEYPDGTRALQGINLQVEAGETVGIVGPNGAGKSTLLLHLNGILKGDGKVNICGVDINGSDSSALKRNVGIVFQDPNDQLFMPTVFDDVAFAPLNQGKDKPEVKRIVEDCLRKVEIEGYGGKITHHLSYGEKKKVAIAAVLAMGPEVLALDEPTANLDPRAKRNLIKTLKSLDITKIIVTHDLEIAKNLCHRIFLVNEGKVVTEGPPEILSDQTLLTDNGL